MYKNLLVLVGTAGSLLWASTAGASTLAIALQESGVNGGALTTVASTGTSNATFNGSYGSFDINNLSASGPLLNDLLDTLAFDSSSTTGGTLTVEVSENGYTTTSGSLDSGFTVNKLSGGYTVQEWTYLDQSNTLFATTTLLGSSGTFTNIAAVSATHGGSPVSPYALTEVITITGSGIGNASSTVDVSATPLPGALPLLATGLVGLWALRRKRKNQSRLDSALAIG